MVRIFRKFYEPGSTYWFHVRNNVYADDDKIEISGNIDGLKKGDIIRICDGWFKVDKASLFAGGIQVVALFGIERHWQETKEKIRESWQGAKQKFKRRLLWLLM